jgi:hypothetical protein
MINADLTEVFGNYREWDYIVRRKYLNYAAKLMSSQHHVIYKGIEYRNEADLKADLDAECDEGETMTSEV